MLKWDLNGDGRLDAYELAQIRAASKQKGTRPPKKPKVPRSVERRAILEQKFHSAAAANASGTEEAKKHSKK